MTRADMDRVRDQFVALHPPRRRSRLRLARTALRARLPAVVLHLAADQPAHRRIRRRARRTACAIRSRCSARCAPPGRQQRPMSVRISAHDWAPGGNTDADAVEIARAFKEAGADFIDVLLGPDHARREAGLRPHVPDALRRPHPQRGRHLDHRGRRHHRRRPGQQHHRRRPRRPLRHRAAAPGRPGLDAARSRQARHSDVDWPKQYRAAATRCTATRARAAAARRRPLALPQANRALSDEEHEHDACCRRRRLDLEARAHSEHPDELRLWLRLLTCTQLIEKQVRNELREQFATTLAALRPDGAARACARRAEDERAVAPHDGHRRQRHRHHRPAGRRRAGGAGDVAGDRRAWRVRLTPRGPQALQRHGAAARSLDRRAFAGLDAEGNHASSHKLLGKVKQHSTSHK